MGSISKHKIKDPDTGELRESGQYRAYIRRKGFKSRSAVFQTRTEARKWLRNNEADAALEPDWKARLGTAHCPTFAVLADRFAEAPTVPGYQSWSPVHLAFWRTEFEDRTPTSISRSDINASIARLREKRAGGPALRNTDKPLSDSTVNRYVATLSCVFNYALDHGLVEVHPVKAGKVRKLREPKGRERIITPEEEQRLYLAADEARWPMMRLYLRMLFTTGARKNEALQLRWQNVDFDQRIAVLPKTKNGDARALPLVGDVLTGLRSAYENRPQGSEFVFYDPRNPTRHKRIEMTWNEVRKRAGLYQDRPDRLDWVVLHSIRHTVATRLLQKGANVAQVANLTGHKTLAMLKRYTHLDARDSLDLAQRLLSDGA